MIEVELKLQVDKFPNLTNLECVKQKRVLDVYYDTPNYKLISTGNFLRNRDNKKVDFKLNIGDLSHTYCKETSFNYNNFLPNESLKIIFDNIGIEYNKNFKTFNEFLCANNLTQLAVIDKFREVYKLDDLIISLDDAKNIGKFIEIEYDLPDNSVVDKEKIKNYMISKLTKLGLTNYTEIKVGYVELYLKQHNKKAYNLGLFKE